MGSNASRLLYSSRARLVESDIVQHFFCKEWLNEKSLSHSAFHGKLSGMAKRVPPAWPPIMTPKITRKSVEHGDAQTVHYRFPAGQGPLADCALRVSDYHNPDQF